MKPKSGASSVELNLWNLAAAGAAERSMLDRLASHDVSVLTSTAWAALPGPSLGLFAAVSPFHVMAAGSPASPVRHDDLLRLLHGVMAKGHDLDQPDAYDWTALGYAAWYGHVRVVDALLECGADPNARNSAALSAALAQIGTLAVRSIWPPAVLPDHPSVHHPSPNNSVASPAPPPDGLGQALESLWAPLWAPILQDCVDRAAVRVSRIDAADDHTVHWPGHSPAIARSSASPLLSLADLSQYWLAPDPCWSSSHATCARLLLRAGATPSTQAPHQSGAPVSSKRTWLAWALGAERFSWANLLWRHGARLTNQDRHAMVLDGSPLPLAWCSLRGESLASLLGTHHEVWPLVAAVDSWVERSHLAAACGTVPPAPDPDQDWLGWLSWLDEAAVLKEDTGGTSSGSGRLL